MTRVIYKQLSCRDAGGSCDFVAKARNEDEVLVALFDHLCLCHGFSEIIPWDTELRWKLAIRDVSPPQRRSRTSPAVLKQSHPH